MKTKLTASEKNISLIHLHSSYRRRKSDGEKNPVRCIRRYVYVSFCLK